MDKDVDIFKHATLNTNLNACCVEFCNVQNMESLFAFGTYHLFLESKQQDTHKRRGEVVLMKIEDLNMKDSNDSRINL